MRSAPYARSPGRHRRSVGTDPPSTLRSDVVSASASTDDTTVPATVDTTPPDRAERVEQWFTAPVVVAAVASVPAMFLTTMEGHAEQVGAAINYATMAVFVAETLVLLALTGDRLEWVRRNRLPVGITVATIPAVIFALGPVQIMRLLRLARVIGALRILRVRRIVKAGRILRVRAGLTGWAWRATFLLLSTASAVFVVFVLADPTSTTRQTIDAAVGRWGFVATAIAGAILAGATYVVARARRSSSDRVSDA